MAAAGGGGGGLVGDTGDALGVVGACTQIDHDGVVFEEEKELLIWTTGRRSINTLSRQSHQMIRCLSFTASIFI